MENSQFDIRKIQERRSFIFRLFVFNNLASLPGIELEKDENKIKPLDLFYYFDDLDQS